MLLRFSSSTQLGILLTFDKEAKERPQCTYSEVYYVYNIGKLSTGVWLV